MRAGGRSGATGAFLLGAAFSLAFCPTLFLLFFVLTLPLALTSPLGVLYPGLFALGTALPLLVLAGVATLTLDRLRPAVRSAKQTHRWLRPAAAVVLLLAGLNDTLVYWAL